LCLASSVRKFFFLHPLLIARNSQPVATSWWA
jgi:hypothetical protein